MLALMLAAAAPPAPASALGLAELPPQVMAPGTCALFLWERATKRRVLMAMANPATARIMRAGKPVALAQASAEGAPVMGFAPQSRYADAEFDIALDLVIVASEGGGAVVRDGTLTATGRDGVAVVAPVAGLVGCR